MGFNFPFLLQNRILAFIFCSGDKIDGFAQVKCIADYWRLGLIIICIRFLKVDNFTIESSSSQQFKISFFLFRFIIILNKTFHWIDWYLFEYENFYSLTFQMEDLKRNLLCVLVARKPEQKVKMKKLVLIVSYKRM